VVGAGLRAIGRRRRSGNAIAELLRLEQED
jgi:hypothetical protein